jgi:hypothetical protein
MKTKQTRSRRASKRRRRKSHERLPGAEMPISRDCASVDAAIMFTDSLACGRAAVWLEPQTDEERACSSSSF